MLTALLTLHCTVTHLLHAIHCNSLFPHNINAISFSLPCLSIASLSLFLPSHFLQQTVIDWRLPAVLIQNCYSRISTDLLRLWVVIMLLGNRKSMPNGEVATKNVQPPAKLQTCVLLFTPNYERRWIKPNTKFGGSHSGV